MSTRDAGNPPEPRPEPLETPERALTIGAHPDDAEFGAGGTLARWADSGCEVSMLIITDGSKGSWDVAADPLDLATARRREQEAAAQALGATGELVFLGHVDGELEPTLALREEICMWIRRLRPTVVLGFDPWRRYMIHPDHRAAGWGLVDGVVAARDHLFFPGQLTGELTKHRPEAMLLWSPDEPDHWEDVSSTFDRKVGALLAHSSQAETTMGRVQEGDDHRASFEDRIRERCARMGELVGLALAEEFKLIRP